MLPVQLDDKQVFLERPLPFDDLWGQMMVPALPALLANASWQRHSNSSPISRSILSDNSSENLILFFGPGSVGHVASVAQLEEALVALDLRFAEDLADTAPRGLSELLDEHKQLRILLYVITFDQNLLRLN